MTKLFVITLVFIAQTASADTLLKFKDGSANVWDNIYVKGGDYCTKKAYGAELCAPKKDVVLKKEVPAGSDPADYGEGATAGLQGQSDNLWAAQADDSPSEAKAKSRRDADDKKAATKRASEDRYYGKDKAEQKRQSSAGW